MPTSRRERVPDPSNLRLAFIVGVLLALLVGGTLFGMFGLILSVPLAAVMKILGQEFVLPPLRMLAEPE